MYIRNMKKNSILIFIIFFLIGFIPTSCSAANLQQGSDIINNPRLSENDRNTAESSTHQLTFTTYSSVYNGSIIALIPASSTTLASNDSLPDSGTNIIDSGFDLNNLDSSNVICSGGTVTWGKPEIIPSSKSTSGKHEIICPFYGKLDVDQMIQMDVGNDQKGLINPLPITNHVANVADVYNIDIRIIDSTDEIVDRINTKMALLDQVEAYGCVGVEAYVCTYRFSLFGYTSPYSQVNLSGSTIQAKTNANQDGYFIFRNLFAPFKPEKLCLYSEDTEGIVSYPICLPPFPVNKDTTIGPVLIPPTIFVIKGNVLIGESAYIVGKTIPNIDVNFSFFNGSKSHFNLIEKMLFFVASKAPIKSIYAYSLPSLKTKATKQGNYQMALSGNNPAFYQIFSSGVFQNATTPKSHTITVQMLPWWLTLIQRWLIPLLLLFIIMLVPIIYLLIKKYFHPFFIHRQRSLILRDKFPIVLEPQELLSFKDRMLMQIS